jgi:hypothetical protein
MSIPGDNLIARILTDLTAVMMGILLIVPTVIILGCLAILPFIH